MATIFQEKPVVTVDLASKVSDALKMMVEHKIHHLVVTKQNQYYGVFSERNFFEHTGKRGVSILEEAVSQCCSVNSKTISSETDLSTALIELAKAEQTALPILASDKTVIGIVTETDLLKVFNNVFQGQEISLVEKAELFIAENPLAQEVIKLLNGIGV